MTQKQASTIREMAMAERPNADIIKATGLPAAEVYAYRSQNDITRAKVKAILAGQATPEPVLVEQTTTETDVHAGKTAFVRDYLTPLLKAVDETITEVEYSVRPDLIETVNIHFKPSGQLIVNVTGDSLAALTRDVLRRID